MSTGWTQAKVDEINQRHRPAAGKDEAVEVSGDDRVRAAWAAYVAIEDPAWDRYKATVGPAYKAYLAVANTIWREAREGK